MGVEWALGGEDWGGTVLRQASTVHYHTGSGTLKRARKRGREQSSQTRQDPL